MTDSVIHPWRLIHCCCSVTKSRPTLCDPMDYSTPGFLSYTISWSLLKFLSIESMMLSNHLILCCLLLLPSSFPTTGSWPMSWLFASGGQSVGVSPSTSVLPINTQDWSPLGGTGWIPRRSFQWSSDHLEDSQESSPTPQFKSINSAVLSFFYSPTLTSRYDYWKNHSFD